MNFSSAVPSGVTSDTPVNVLAGVVIDANVLSGVVTSLYVLLGAVTEAYVLVGVTKELQASVNGVAKYQSHQCSFANNSTQVS